MLESLYFVIETKGDVNNLRPSEKAKIESAKKHFEIVKVNYKEVDSYQSFAENALK
jgi:restriction endonuclease